MAKHASDERTVNKNKKTKNKFTILRKKLNSSPIF